MTDAISLFPLGGCLVHGPLNPEARDGTRLKYAPYGRVPGVYTFGEMFQVIDVLRGKRVVPAEVEPLCGIKGNFHAVAGAADFADVDIVLAEPASPIDIIFRECSLNRAALAQAINPIGKVSREAAKQLNQWFRIGIMGVNDEVRADAAKALLPFVSDDIVDAPLVRAILTDTRVVTTDVESAVRRLQAEMGRPLGIVNFVHQYMPDGRAVSWPAGFHEQIAEVAETLDLPLFRPSVLVNKYGVSTALRPDARHYKDEFLPIMADALIEFAHAVRRGATAKAA